MADIAKVLAIGLQVSSVLTTADQTVITFTNGSTVRHRRRPLSETVNTINLLSAAFTAHDNQTLAAAHTGVIAVFASNA